VKILYLTPGCFDKGGISRYSRYQVAALRDLVGEDYVRALSLLGPDQDSFEEPFQVEWHGAGSNWLQKARFASRTLAAAMLWRPEVLWCAHVNMSGLAKLAASPCGAKVVLNTYGLEVWSGFRRDAAFGLKHADFVLSDCHATAEYLEGEGLRPRGTLEVVWDCVDLRKFAPGRPAAEVFNRYGIPDPSTGINLLTLGRMTRDADHKGYTRLYEVFRRIADLLPELRLVFAGRGQLAEDLKASVMSDHLEKRVFFTGGIHEADLPDVYRAAHFFSLVSDRGKGRGEGIPLTPLEAAACALPILVGTQDGSREAVDNGQNGFILDPYNLEEHCKVVTRLAKDRALRESMGTAARKKIELEFAFDAFREKHRFLLQNWQLQAR
jgi:phosphatidyl-myo-inositol dimannoside synthase